MKLPILVLIAFLTLLQSGMYAQGILRVEANTFLKVTGNAVIKLNNASLDVQGSFSPGTGTVEFQGNTTDATISAAQPLRFNHLTLNKPGHILQLNSDIQADSNVTFTAGTLELNWNDLTLNQPGGKLVNESEANHITGLSGGEVLLTTTLNAPNGLNPGNIGVTLTSASNLGITTIRRGHTPLVLPAIGNSVNRYIDVSPANNNNLNATLQFHYFNAELNGLMEGNLNLFRLNGTTWESGILLSAAAQSQDATANWVEKTGLVHLSTWRLAECAVFSATISGSATFCVNGNTTLDAGAPYTSYLWTGGATTQTLLVNMAGTYTVTVSDANGCTGTDTLVVTQSNSLSPAILGGTLLCVNGNTVLDAGTGTGLTYLWSTGATTQTLPVSMANTYSVTITDAGGCTGTDTQVVTQGPPVNPAISGPISICTAGNAILNAGTYAGYLWSTGATTSTITVNTAGTYSVTVTDINTCMGADTHAITLTPPVMPTITGSATYCASGSTLLDAGAGFAMYKWSDGNTTQTLSVNIAGTYTVTVSDANSCTGTDTQSVTQSNNLSTTILGPAGLCPSVGDTLDAGGIFDQYLWSNGGTSQFLPITTPGTYSVTVSNMGGCSGTATVLVQAFQGVTATAATPGTLNCNTAQITLTATGTGLTYNWSTGNGNILSGAMSANATIDKGGDYQLIASSSQGCKDTLVLNVIQTGVPVTGIELELIPIKCFGDNNGVLTVTEVATGSMPFQYALNGGPFQLDNVFEPLAPGNYSLVVKDKDGCTRQQMASLSEPDSLEIDIPKPALVKEAQPVEMKPEVNGGVEPYVYSWNGPELSCTDCEIPTAKPLFTSLYRLTITDANGCTNVASVLVDVNSKSGTDIITAGEDKNGTLKFAELEADPEKYKDNDIVIFNRWGQVVYEAAPYRNQWNGVDKNGKELPEGTYYYLLLLRDGGRGERFGNVLLVR